jgi:hypothetical protein
MLLPGAVTRYHVQEAKTYWILDLHRV